jgi:hypothetical protein
MHWSVILSLRYLLGHHTRLHAWTEMAILLRPVATSYLTSKLNQNSYLPVDGIKQSEPMRMAACLRILQLKIIQTWPKMIYLYKVSSIALGGHLNFEGSHRRQALKTN